MTLACGRSLRSHKPHHDSTAIAATATAATAAAHRGLVGRDVLVFAMIWQPAAGT